jgi:hypothetical protein
MKEERSEKINDEKVLFALKRSARSRKLSLDDIIKEHIIIEDAKKLDMKYCYKCLRVLEKSCFGKHNLASDGLNPTCKECRSKHSRNHYKNNIEHISITKKIYSKNNREKIIKRQKQYVKKRKDEDIMFRLKLNLRARLKKYIRHIGGSHKLSRTTISMIGCLPEELRKHIENQFNNGMSWDNYGRDGWHIDHIIPLCSAKTIEEAFKLNHYTNLQPLWSIDNYKKGGRV